MARVCGNCGNTQGPFDKFFVGFRKTGHWIFTCPVDKKLTPEKQADQAKACTARREKRYATA